VPCLQYRKAHPDEKGTERRYSISDISSSTSIARPIPMKRELKDNRPAIYERTNAIARPIPMKRELKVKGPIAEALGCNGIARPIPMKRELKERLPVVEELEPAGKSQGPSR